MKGWWRALKGKDLIFPLISFLAMAAIFWALFSWYHLSLLRREVEVGKQYVAELPGLKERLEALGKSRQQNSGRKDDLVNYLKNEVPARYALGPVPEAVQSEETGAVLPEGGGREVAYKVIFEKVGRSELVRYLHFAHETRPFLMIRALRLSSPPDQPPDRWKAEVVFSYWEATTGSGG